MDSSYDTGTDPSVVNDRSPPFCDPLAIRIESRIGRRRSDPAREGGGGLPSIWSSGGGGGTAVRSFTLSGECERKESAVSQMKCRS